MAVAEVRLKRAEMVASVNCIVIVGVIGVNCLRGRKMKTKWK